MLEAVLEMSRQEAGLSAPPPMEDEPTSSPDTGFGDTDAHDLAYHTDLLETDTKQPAGSPRSWCVFIGVTLTGIWVLLKWCVDLV